MLFVVIVEIQQDVAYFFRSFPLYRQTLFQIGVERGDILKFFGKAGKSVQKSLWKLDECLFYPFVCRTRQFVVYPAMGDVGSGSLIAEALAEQIRSQGGEVICNAEVDELLEKEGQLTGVRCKDGRIYEGIQFICATHPAEMCRMLKQGGLLKNVYRHRICRQENTNGMFTVSLCLKPHALPYANWNYYVYRHPDIWTYPSDGEIDRVLAASHVPDDGGEYVRQIDLLAPMDWSLCRPWIFTQVGKRGPEYEAMKSAVIVTPCTPCTIRLCPVRNRSGMGVRTGSIPPNGLLKSFRMP